MIGQSVKLFCSPCDGSPDLRSCYMEEADVVDKWWIACPHCGETLGLMRLVEGAGEVKVTYDCSAPAFITYTHYVPRSR